MGERHQQLELKVQEVEGQRDDAIARMEKAEKGKKIVMHEAKRMVEIADSKIEDLKERIAEGDQQLLDNEKKLKEAWDRVHTAEKARCRSRSSRKGFTRSNSSRSAKCCAVTLCTRLREASDAAACFTNNIKARNEMLESERNILSASWPVTSKI